MFDAEHFFDGFKNNKNYAFDCLKSAYDSGAKWIILCDTNGVYTLSRSIGNRYEVCKNTIR